jgi:hypothetical protein
MRSGTGIMVGDALPFDDLMQASAEVAARANDAARKLAYMPEART